MPQSPNLRLWGCVVGLLVRKMGGKKRFGDAWVVPVVQREKRNQVTPSASMRGSARARRVATGDMPSLCLS